MSAVDDFQSQFDEEGRYRAGNGALAVVMATRGGGRYPGKLHFSNGLCVRAEMAAGGEWGQADQSPVNGIRFLLHFGADQLHEIAIADGRVLDLGDATRRSTKSEFLSNFKTARNLFVHSQMTADGAPALARTAIWLTPKSVAGFDAADFKELGAKRLAELRTAVQAFLAVATQVPASTSATAEQHSHARSAFAAMLEILAPYLPLSDEAERVETALRRVPFPAWVVNWDFELASDADVPAIRLNVFADEQSLPRSQIGRAASDLTTEVRHALAESQITRWPYIRMRTALEHKAG